MKKESNDKQQRELLEAFNKHQHKHNSRMKNRIDSRNSAVNKRIMSETGQWAGAGGLGGGAVGAGIAALAKKNPLKGAAIGAGTGATATGGLALADLWEKGKQYKISPQQEEAIMKMLDQKHNQTRSYLQKQGSEDKLKTWEDVEKLIDNA